MLLRSRRHIVASTLSVLLVLRGLWVILADLGDSQLGGLGAADVLEGDLNLKRTLREDEPQCPPAIQYFGVGCVSS